MKRMDEQSRPCCSYVNKLGYLLETPLDPRVLATLGGSDNLRGADNQQERLLVTWTIQDGSSQLGESSETARQASAIDEINEDDTVRSA